MTRAPYYQLSQSSGQPMTSSAPEGQTGPMGQLGTTHSLQPVDYAMVGAVLVVPLAIGLWFAVRDAKRNTRDEYLLGGRRMAAIPVTLSLFVTFQSSLSVLLAPAEIYTHGAMVVVLYLGVCLSHVVGCFTLVPLFYSLRLTSVYEYLERRYRSRSLRLISTVLGMLQTLFFLVIVQLTSALALKSTAGIPLWLSVAVVGGVCTLYTALGGLKTVIWTDAFQAAVLVTCVTWVIVRGAMVVGGFEKVVEISLTGGRCDFSKTNPDPRERNTWPGNLIGGFFMWLVTLCNQSTVQRISSLRSAWSAQRTFALNIPLHLLYATLLACLGLVVYAYFTSHRCDPLASGSVSTMEQIVPYFVLQAMADTPGMAAVFVATLFSGCLSTLSSGINALAANTVEDLLEPRLRGVSEVKVTSLTKLMAFLYGGVTIALTYAATSVNGSVTQVALVALCVCGGPVVGVFLAGAAVPWVHRRGALAGLLLALGLTMWVALGNCMYGRGVPSLQAPPTDGCPTNDTSDSSSTTRGIQTPASSLTTIVMSSRHDDDFNITFVDGGFNIAFYDDAVRASDEPTPDPSAQGFFVYDISYEWYALIGTMTSFLCSIIFSFSRKRGVHAFRTDSRLVFPAARRYWQLAEPTPTEDEVCLESVFSPIDDDEEGHLYNKT